MRALGTLLIVCAALAAVKAAMLVLMLIFAIMLTWAVCVHPREMLGFMTYCGVFAIIGAHPAFSLSIITMAVVAAQFAKTAERSP